jgi:hypothetical protein
MKLDMQARQSAGNVEEILITMKNTIHRERLIVMNAMNFNHMEVKDINSFLPALEKEEHVFYYCLLAGSFNLLFMSYKPIDFSHLKGYKRTAISGVRSNYYVPRAMNRNCEMVYRNIENACGNEIDTSMFDLTLEEIYWTQELWDLYLDLKYDISIDFTPLVKKHRLMRPHSMKG